MRLSMQTDPLKPGYNFDAHLVAGLTSIIEGNDLDFTINRPTGMKGYILNLTIKGQGRIFSGENAFDVKKGDLLLFPPGVPHYYRRDPDCSNWFHRWVYFRPRAFWSDWLQWHDNNHDVFVTQGLGTEVLNGLEPLFIDIEHSAKSDNPYHGDLALNLLEQLLIRCKTLQPGVISRRIDPRILEVIHYMSQNLSRDFSNDELAAIVCISSSRLGHLFRAEMGMTITQWRDDQRITRAKQLLVTTNHSINKISRIIGYSDPLYFSRVFKRIAGVSPKNYRDQIT